MKIELIDSKNNYLYGEIKADGKIELFDHENNYIYGQVKVEALKS